MGRQPKGAHDLCARRAPEEGNRKSCFGQTLGVRHDFTTWHARASAAPKFASRNGQALAAIYTAPAAFGRLHVPLSVGQMCWRIAGIQARSLDQMGLILNDIGNSIGINPITVELTANRCKCRLSQRQLAGVTSTTQVMWISNC
jgi:hypothetical protein